jgi:hypothetical protein
MDSAIEKLELGLERLSKAGEDADLLGLALQSIHGALEDYFRTRLAADTHMPADQREAVLDPKRVQWKDLLDAMQLYGDLSAQDRETIWRANGQRTRVAHGGRYNGTRADLERYAALAQQLCGYTAPAKPAAPSRPAAKPPRPSAERPAPRANSAAHASSPAEAPEIPRAVRSQPVAPQQRSRVGWWSILIVIGLLVALASFVVLRSVARPLTQLAAAPAAPSSPAAEPTAAAVSASTPAQPRPRAATVNATDGLNLRRDHSSNAPVLAALPNGAQVTVLAGPIHAEGHSWWQIEANGQQGWCAGEFLLFDRTP